MTTPVVSVRNVTKKINGKTIVDKVSFELKRGEIFGFLGPNGAGKTTTIRMLVGLIAMTEGEVFIKGHSIKTSFEAAIKEVGAIVEAPQMYSYLTGYQNLVHYARMADGVCNERMQKIIDLVGLKKSINDKVKTYSLGMRQRLGLAQALLHSPSLLILDEPTNGLDPSGIREIRDYLKRLAKEEGLTIIVSSHLLAEMELMCDKVGIIQAGKLVNVQTMSEFIVEQHGGVIQFDVDQLLTAVQLVKKHASFAKVIDHSQYLQIEATKQEIAKINRLLVDNNVNVYEIKRIEMTLEDKFLELTGGKTNA